MKGFEFGEFLLDLEERVLFRNGEPVPLTPKAFRLLEVLVENRGRLLEKEYLFRAVWQERFVEEGNLPFTVRLLRKALEDDRANPRFIETVPRRGYRFVCEVRLSAQAAPAADGYPRLERSIPSSERSLYRHPAFRLLGTALILSVLAGAAWFSAARTRMPEPPILANDFNLVPLSMNGTVINAAISGTGTHIVYVNESGNGKKSVWLRDLDGGNNIEILPPSDDTYLGLALSADGRLLFFNRRPRSESRPGDIYRMEVLGNIPEKIVSGAEGWVSVSPGGEKISFIRCPGKRDSDCSLWTAASTGGQETKLVEKRWPERLRTVAFSPDGRSIAFAHGQSENAADDFRVSIVDVETGAVRAASRERFFNVKGIVWLDSGGELLLAAKKASDIGFGLWRVTGENLATRVKDHSANYSTITADSRLSRLVAISVRGQFSLSVFSIGGDRLPEIETEAMTASFGSGKIFFSSIESGNSEIWSFAFDGSGKRQLTNDAALDTSPVVSEDGGRVFFASNRSGEIHVFSMRTDGTEVRQLTTKTGGFPISASSDGRWVYYQSGSDRTLWKVRPEGGGDVLVDSTPRYRYAVTADGDRVAYSENVGGLRWLVVKRLSDGVVMGRFRTHDPGALITEICWGPDSETILYVATDNEFLNNKVWVQSENGEKPKLVVDLGKEAVMALNFSEEGDRFAVIQGGYKHDAVLIKGLK